MLLDILVGTLFSLVELLGAMAFIYVFAGVALA